MFIKSFTLQDTHVQLTLSNGNTFLIYLTADSGKAYYRNKIDSPSKIKHPGIFLGVDVLGIQYFMHNHYQDGRPAIVTAEEFAKEQPIYPYDINVVRTPMQIIAIGLQQVIEAKPYTWKDYNCQSFVNVAANGQNISEDVIRWVGSVFFGLIAFAGIRAFAVSKRRR